MFRVYVSPLAVAAALLVCAPATSGAAAPASPAAQQAATGLPADPDVRVGMLPNGMRYMIKRNIRPPGEASLRLRIDAGSMHEAENQRGIAHFLEHMVLNGTTHVPEGEFVRRLERHGLRFGPDTNASTGFTQTVYKLELPETDDETVDTALYLFREIADEATLDPSAIESERGIVLSEERSRATPAYRTLVDQFLFYMRGQLMPKRLPIGLTEVLAKAPRERFVEFYNAYYRPERATLIAVGDFDVDAMEAKIKAQFGSWRGEGADGAEPDRGVVAERKPEARVYVEAGAPERVSITWVRPPDLRPDTRALRAERLADRLALQILRRRLDRIASVGDSAPFIAASASSGDQADSAQVVQLGATIRPGEWRAALQSIEQEQRRLVEHGVSAAELELEIERMRTGFATAVSRAGTRRSSDLSDGLVSAIDEDQVFTDPSVNLAIFNETLASLTRERVQQAARDMFKGNGPLVYVSSAKPIEGGEQALLAGYRQSVAQAVSPMETREAIAWPYTDFGTPGAVVERREVGDGIDATLVRFANGVRLTVKPTDFTDNEILVTVRIGDGRNDIPPGTPSPTWALGPGFITGGVERIGFEDMREALASASVDVKTLLLEDSLALSGRTRPEDFATQMQMLAAYVSEPAWDPSGWDRVRAMSETRHRQYEATPDGVYERDAAALLHSGDSRWRTPSLEEMAASDIGEIRSMFEDALKHEPIEIVVIGDVTVDEAIAQTAATFGALPQRQPETDSLRPPRFPAASAQPVRLTHSGRADQGLAMIAWPTAGLYADPAQSRALAVLTSIFRLRLTELIREKQGATYSPVANQVVSSTFDNFGFLFGRIEAPPAALDKFLADAAGIARDLAENPVGADELERARRPMIEGLERSRSSNIFWQFSLPGLQEDPRVGKAIIDQRSQYASVTPAQLQKIARQFLRPDTAWKLVIVPKGRQESPSP